MRAFVVGTGRCGTCTFYQAAKLIPGWSAEHEGKAGSLPPWEFPDNHIEIGSHLAPVIPMLRFQYPDAKWVHLVRDEDACVKSLADQCTIEMEYYAQTWFHAFRHPRLETAQAYYRTVNAMIDGMLPTKLVVQIENAGDHWQRFIDHLGVQNPTPAEVADIFQRRYNPSEARGRDSYR